MARHPQTVGTGPPIHAPAPPSHRRTPTFPGAETRVGKTGKLDVELEAGGFLSSKLRLEGRESRSESP